MKRFAVPAPATLVAGTASASVPVFVATCPTDINVRSGRTGVVLVTGQKATVKKINAYNYDAKAGDITISVTANPGKAPDVFDTGKGRATDADLSQSDGNMKLKASKQADLNKIQAGNERYEIPEAAVFGG